MPKFISTVLRTQLRLVKPLVNNRDLESCRKAQDKLGRLGTAIFDDAVSFTDEPFDNFDAVWAVPKNEKDGRVILYLHGGSYTSGSVEYARAFGAVLSDVNKCKTLCPGYRLAPENPFPAALEDAYSAYERCLEFYPPEKIIVAGESAGGGLCFSLMLKLKELGAPMPACAVSISPWADLTLSGKSYNYARWKDPCLNKKALCKNAEYYAEGMLDNPLVSPVFGDLQGLPPSLIIAGSNEILLSDAVKLSSLLRKGGVECRTVIEKKMWHAYILYGVPEAKKALNIIRNFINKHAV